MNIRKNLLVAVTGILVVLVGTSCETNFEPLQPDHNYVFSMYGALDLHADTQWVRVMPIGKKLIPTDPEPNGVEVTLTRESTGETVTVNDSLFVFGGNTYVWNYWTTTPLRPREEYTLRAEAPDGRYSNVTVTLPSRLPLPIVNYSTESAKATVTGSSVDSLVMADTKFYVQVVTDFGFAPEVELSFSHLDDVYVDMNGDFRFTLDVTLLISRQLKVKAGDFIINRKELHLATGSKDWPDLSGLSEEEMLLPEVVSNVENGTGLVAGIASRKVPLKSCFDEEGDQIACGEME